MTFRFTASYVALAAVLLAAANARADNGGGLASSPGFSNIGSDAALRARDAVQVGPGRAGVSLSETSLLHVGVGAEGGYDSNVFYSKLAPTAAPMLRVTPFAELTNGTRSGGIPPIFYNLRALLQYREYLSDDAAVKAQRAFNPNLAAALKFSSGQQLSFQLMDTFTRVQDPPYERGNGNIVRDTNLVGAELRVAPGGGRIDGTLRYSNLLDYFEDPSLTYASSLAHELLADLSWKWYPNTAVFLEASQGMISYLKDAPAAVKMSPSFTPKQGSYPSKALLGLRGLVTNKLSVNLAAGYAAAFYQGGAANPSGFGNVAGLAELGYQPTPMTELRIGYRHEYRNSVLGDFYDVDTPYFSVRQSIAQRVSFSGTVRYESRRFKGYKDQGVVVTRNDNFLQAGLSAD